MKIQKPLSTRQVARYCQVNFKTVLKWIEEGKLKGYKLPDSGVNKIQPGDLLDFLERFHFPVPAELKGAGIPRILIVDDEINAINMLDGLDGLAGGVALSALIWLAIGNVLAGAGFCSEGLALIGALAGFLIFNARYPGHPKASLYLGDAGSTTLGLVLGYIALRQCANQTDPLTPVSIFWVLALPVVDTLRVMIVRKLRGHSPFAADRTHLHHLMSDLGHYSAGTVTWSLVMLNLIFGAMGVLGHYFGIQDSWLMLGILVLLVSSVIVGYLLEHRLSKVVGAEKLADEVTV